MNLFRRLHVENEQKTLPHSRSRLVFADNLFEAMSVAPDGFAVTSVEVQVGTAVDPRRLIRPVRAPGVHRRDLSLAGGGASLATPTTDERSESWNGYQRTGSGYSSALPSSPCTCLATVGMAATAVIVKMMRERMGLPQEANREDHLAIITSGIIVGAIGATPLRRMPLRACG